MSPSSRPTARPAIDRTTRVLAAVGAIALFAGVDPVLRALSDINGVLAFVVFLLMATIGIALALLALGLVARPRVVPTTAGTAAGPECARPGCRTCSRMSARAGSARSRSSTESGRCSRCTATRRS